MSYSISYTILFSHIQTYAGTHPYTAHILWDESSDCVEVASGQNLSKTSWKCVCEGLRERDRDRQRQRDRKKGKGREKKRQLYRKIYN